MWDKLWSQTGLSRPDSSVLSLSFWHHSGLQHPQDIILCHWCNTPQTETTKHVMYALTFISVCYIRDHEEWALSSHIYVSRTIQTSPTLFYNTGCLCLCLHWLQIIVMLRVWGVVWNVKCNSISTQWFCVVEGFPWYVKHQRYSIHFCLSETFRAIRKYMTCWYACFSSKDP